VGCDLCACRDECPGMWVCTSGLRWLAMVRAASAYIRVFEVTADYVNISGFNVIRATGVEKAGIYLNGRQHCKILDNIADSRMRNASMTID